MSNRLPQPGKPAKSDAKAARETRLAAALRANLKRRKVAASGPKHGDEAAKPPEARKP